MVLSCIFILGDGDLLKKQAKKTVSQATYLFKYLKQLQKYVDDLSKIETLEYNLRCVFWSHYTKHRNDSSIFCKKFFNFHK